MFLWYSSSGSPAYGGGVGREEHILEALSDPCPLLSRLLSTLRICSSLFSSKKFCHFIVFLGVHRTKSVNLSSELIQILYVKKFGAVCLILIEHLWKFWQLGRSAGMEPEQGKLFIGGISWETTEERLKEYFEGFGEVVETMIMKDRVTGRSRGFGFVIFSDSAVADRVVQEKHTIDGRVVEAKKAVPREEQQNITRSNSSLCEPVIQISTRKVFVGGLPSTITESDFKEYFEQFGTIIDVVVMYDQTTQRPRGFGFVTYDSEGPVEKVMQKTFHELKGKAVEVKRAIPKEFSTGPSRTSSSGLGMSGGRGSIFSSVLGHGYGPSPTGSCGARMNLINGHAPGGRVGYPPCGPGLYGGGYGTGAGYGHSMSMGYGGSAFGSNPGCGIGTVGSYGVGSYGGASNGFGGAVGYAGSNAGHGGYLNSPLGGRNMWSSGDLGRVMTGSSIGCCVAGSGAMIGHGGAGIWDSAPGSIGWPIGSCPAYTSGSYGHGNTENTYSSIGGGFAGQSSGYGVGAATYGLANGGHGREYSDVNTNSVYGDSTWKFNASELTRSLPVGYGLGSAAADGLASYGGVHDVVGSLTQRGVVV